MKFPTITIPDPAAVGKWLDERVPCVCQHKPAPFNGNWSVTHWDTNIDCFTVTTVIPEDLLTAIQWRLKQRDPLAKLRAEADKHGYVLMKMPTD
jgi:hypothetical protein